MKWEHLLICASETKNKGEKWVNWDNLSSLLYVSKTDFKWSKDFQAHTSIFSHKEGHSFEEWKGGGECTFEKTVGHFTQEGNEIQIKQNIILWVDHSLLIINDIDNIGCLSVICCIW